MKTAPTTHGIVLAVLLALPLHGIFAPIDDSLFGQEIRSTLHLGIGLGYGKILHPWYDQMPLDQGVLRLRFLSDAGNFYPNLRGVYGDLEVSMTTAQFLGKDWTYQSIAFLNLNLGFSFRDNKQNTTFFPFVQVGAGFTGVASRSQGAVGYHYDPTVHFSAKAGFEWILLGGWLSLAPGVSATYMPYASGTMLAPMAHVGFHIDVMGYFL